MNWLTQLDGNIEILKHPDFQKGRDDKPLAHMPVHIANDEYKRRALMAEGAKICKRCDGTGNQLMSMYQKCESCKGRGKAP